MDHQFLPVYHDNFLVIQEFVGKPMQFYRQPSLDQDMSVRTDEVKRSMAELSACWQAMQAQVTDKQVRLERALVFQQQYQEAMQSVSAWLDSVELKLFSGDYEKNTEEQLKDNGVRNLFMLW